MKALLLVVDNCWHFVLMLSLVQCPCNNCNCLCRTRPIERHSSIHESVCLRRRLHSSTSLPSSWLYYFLLQILGNTPHHPCSLSHPSFLHHSSSASGCLSFPLISFFFTVSHKVQIVLQKKIYYFCKSVYRVCVFSFLSFFLYYLCSSGRYKVSVQILFSRRA